MGSKKKELPGNGSAEIIPFSDPSQKARDDKNDESQDVEHSDEMRLLMDDSLSLLERLGLDPDEFEHDESGNLTEEGIMAIRKRIKPFMQESITPVETESLKRWIGDEESD